MRRSRRPSNAYSREQFREIPFGPRGHIVTAYERGRSGKAYLRYTWGGKIKKVALGVNIYTVDGQIDPNALATINNAQRQAVAALLAGEDPLQTRTAARQGEDRADPGNSKLTLERAFELYLGEGGPVNDVSREQRRRYERTRRHAVRFFGGKLVSTLTVADLEAFATSRRRQIAEHGRRPSSGGVRQAEIEVVCLLAVFRWLATSYGATEVTLTRAPALLERLRSIRAPDQPRFSDEEVEAIEGVVAKADPRLGLLLTIQGAQRAGQLLRARRSAVTIRPSEGNLRAVLQIAGSKKKKGGRHFLTPSASLYLGAVLQSGYLSELEKTFAATGQDYYLFPGGIGNLPPGGVVGAGEHRAWDRTVALNSFKELEQLAGVKHVPKRGFHGFRRRAVDILVAMGASFAEIQAAGSWTTSQIPLEVYRSGVTDTDGQRAADLLETARSRSRSRESEQPQATPPGLIVAADYPETSPDLAQLLKAKNLSDEEVAEVLELSQWAWVELNYRPHAYQACALTT